MAMISRGEFADMLMSQGYDRKVGEVIHDMIAKTLVEYTCQPVYGKIGRRGMGYRITPVRDVDTIIRHIKARQFDKKQEASYLFRYMDDVLKVLESVK